MLEAEKPMTTTHHRHLTSVSVRGLFGQIDHVIPLNADGITLVHGPNGIGKTTVLKMIQLAMDRDFFELAKCEFGEMCLMFDDDFTYRINRSAPSQDELEDLRIDLLTEGRDSESEFLRGAGVELSISVENAGGGMAKCIKTDLFLESDAIRQLESQEFWDAAQSERLKELPREARERFVEELRKVNLQEQLKEVVDHLPEIEVHAVPSERLNMPMSDEPNVQRNRWAHAAGRRGRQPITPSRDKFRRRRHQQDKPTLAVDFFSDRMRDTILSTRRQAAGVSESLDRTFAHRVLTSDTPVFDVGLLRNRYQEQVETWRQLETLGLTGIAGRRVMGLRIPPKRPTPEPLQLPEEHLDETQRRVLHHYVADTAKKLEEYQELLQKVELFLGIINDRFGYSGKTVRCDVENGLSVETKVGTGVPLALLSSGEQHEIVLCFQLVFGLGQGTLILIDEPEISLHVSWQREFIGQLQKISEVNGHRFIVATHSPQIIGDYGDQTVALGLGDSMTKENG